MTANDVLHAWWVPDFAVKKDAIPGFIEIDRLVDVFSKLVDRSAVYKRDVIISLEDPEKIKQLLEQNPINAWVSERALRGGPYFNYNEGRFETVFDIPDNAREKFQEIVREIIEWRLAQYQARSSESDANQDSIVCKVSHSQGKPLLFLPERSSRKDIPFGWTPVVIDGETHEANFVKIAVNVVRKEGSDSNVLPSILRKWFGPDVGRPGTNFKVFFESTSEGYTLAPFGNFTPRTDVELWHQYSREEIPSLFGYEFNTGAWNQGIIVKENNMFLLVTLEKEDLDRDHQYNDKFLGNNLFQWESQNRNTQASNRGQMLKFHKEKEINIHLFIRRNKRAAGGSASPFIYCGKIDFVDWEGERPIKVQWHLNEPVPERLREVLKVPL